MSLYKIDDGRVSLNFHPGQFYTWQARQRWIIMAAGTQGGKTSFGPWWLHREIYGSQDRPPGGPGDYLAVSSTYDTLRLKMLPELRTVFEDILSVGRYWSGPRVMELAHPEKGFMATNSNDTMWGKIILRSASAPAGLESATARAAWLDEAGQDQFKLKSMQAIRRRLSLARGRCLMTTTLYNLGWLVQEFIEPCEEAEDAQTKHITTDRGAEITVTAAPSTDTELIQFDSFTNQLFSPEEYESARATMTDHQFNLFYRGRAAQPPGLIYADYNRDLHTIPPIPIPPGYNPFCGIDFGPNNTYALIAYYHKQRDHLLITDIYHRSRRTTEEHAAAILGKFDAVPIAVGGAPSEHQYRDDYTAAGLKILHPPVADVEAGIDRVTAYLKANRIQIFTTCALILDEFGRYRRKMDTDYQPTDEIKDKNSFHCMDALRYLITLLSDPPPRGDSRLIVPGR